MAVAIPSGGAVTQYITDLPAYSGLGGCAAYGLSYAVQGMTNSLCPPGVSLVVIFYFIMSYSKVDLCRRAAAAQKIRIRS